MALPELMFFLRNRGINFARFYSGGVVYPFCMQWRLIVLVLASEASSIQSYLRKSLLFYWLSYANMRFLCINLF